MKLTASSTTGSAHPDPLPEETVDKREPHPSRRSQKKGPPQGERKSFFENSNSTARPEEPPSSGGVSTGARWRESTVPEGEGTQERSAVECGRSALRIASHGEDDTHAFGARLGRQVRGGELIGLVGELGSGKTCFVRGVAEGLGIAPQKVRSPTFTLVNEYSGGRLPLYHIDLYRLVPSPVDRMALRDYLYGDGVCVVEWFERFGEASPHLWIQFTFVGADERALVAQGRGAQYDGLVDRLREG